MKITFTYEIETIQMGNINLICEIASEIFVRERCLRLTAKLHDDFKLESKYNLSRCLFLFF